MNTPELIRRKREGGEIPEPEIKEFIDAYVAGDVPDYQMSAFLMAVFFQGMTPPEAATLTKSMMGSGVTYDLSDLPGPKTDKHSTGGVGDKVSLILAPLVACAGGVVPMVSGRGLGHSGGTLDKLDSIPGYRWDLDQKTFKRQLEKVGCAIIGQTENFVPADKRLYALRDVTATVESIPLICGSILSKKAAAGTKFLVMDVKCGSGAFMDTLEKARQLAEGLRTIGSELDMRVSSIITQMGQPLGEMVGNGLEILETLDLLRGEGPEDSRVITLELCAEMLVISGLEKDTKSALGKLESLLSSGKAMEKFQEWIAAQGGDPRIVEDPSLIEISSETSVLESDRDGWVSAMNTRDIGVAGNLLGAGRMKTDDVVDTTVGLKIHVKPGTKVSRGEPLVTLYHRGGRNLDKATTMLRNAIAIEDGETKPLPLILDRLGPV
ncbi:MAG: thymidine phosphorylase [Candidatus Sumerlaeia bacterium]|nr:thymidine phosphorylase [Candidatus Sumerlaeia bacterium]